MFQMQVLLSWSFLANLGKNASALSRLTLWTVLFSTILLPSENVYQMKSDDQGNLLIEFFFTISFEKFDKFDVENHPLPGPQRVYPILYEGSLWPPYH